MNGAWLRYTTLRIASLLVPSYQRARWMVEWRSELWYVPPCRATIFCMGAFRDAFWMRRSHSVHVKRTRIRLESPLSCVALLGHTRGVEHLVRISHASAAPGAGRALESTRLGRDMHRSADACLLLLPAALWVWRPPASRYSVSWSSKLRRGIFLVVKIALLQSMVLCGSLVQILLGPLGRLTVIAGAAAAVLALRWVIIDQQRRCPMCLRLLTSPIIIGTPSRTFLEWYGTEWTCPHGHGLLHTSEISSSYSRPQWLGLDDSWSGLFTHGASD